VALEPDEPRARLFLARALYAAGRLEEALGHNALASRLDPGLAEAHSDRCAMLLAAGDVPSAEASCLSAAGLDPGLAEAHANLGVVRARRGRWTEAEASYRQALDLDPALPDARYNLAALCERQGRWREGLSVLGPLIDSPAVTDAETLDLAARLALGAGDHRAAERYRAGIAAIEGAPSDGWRPAPAR
jgi:Flp pilus assembly protein TadD